MTSAAFLVPFSRDAGAAWQLWRAGELHRAVARSRRRCFSTGFVLPIAVGMPVGLLLARVRAAAHRLEPYIMMLYATPMVALIPFILSLMGFGFAPKVLVVFLFAVFPVLYNTVEGARSIKPEMIEVARSFRSSEWALWREVMVPYTLPYTMTGVRQAIGRALVGMVAAEFFLELHRPRPAHHERVAEFRHRRRVRLDPRSSALIGVGADAARPDDRAALRALEELTDGRVSHCRLRRDRRVATRRGGLSARSAAADLRADHPAGVGIRGARSSRRPMSPSPPPW